MSVAYLPPISWIKEAYQHETVILEAWETYPKQTYRNRCRIMTSNDVLPLIIPVTKVDGKSTKTKDIEIFYDEPWQRLHWRSIDAAYSNSPFYLYYKDELEKFYLKKYRFLLDLNLEILDMLFNILGRNTSFEISREYQHKPDSMTDLRNNFSPKMLVEKSRCRPYHQVFEDRFGFIHDLSIIDLLFNEGPASQEFFK